MWEPRALDLFRVVVLGCEPAVCAIVRNGFLGSIHSTVTTWSRAAERLFPSLLRVSRESHSSCSVLGDLLSFLCKNGAFLFFISLIILCEILCTEMMVETLVWQNLLTVIFSEYFEQYWSSLETPFSTQINCQSCYFLIYETRFYLLKVHTSLKQKL